MPSGVGAGRPLRLRPWQREFILDIYASVDAAGTRKVRRAILSMARKNGKTLLIAALLLVHLIGPEAVDNGEIISAANTVDQASEIFKYAAQMVRASPKLNGRLTVVDSTKRIVCYGNGSFYKAISRDAKSKHGGNPTVVIYDELAQAIDRDLYDVLDTSQGAREEPLFVAISTQSRDPQHIFSQLVDDGLRGEDETIVCHLYAVPDDAEDIFDEAIWAQANPALDDFRMIEDFRANANRARRLPSFEASFRNLYLNQRVSQESPLIPASEWRACGARIDIEDGEAVFGGLDLSGRTDLSALGLVSERDGDRIKAWFWKPEALLEEHERRDRVPYPLWARDEWITATPGRVIDYRYIAITLAEVAARYDLRGVAFDRWRIFDLQKAAAEEGISCWIDGKDDAGAGIRLVPWGQGFKDMGPAVDAFEQAVMNRTLKHDNNPVLTWNVANAIAETDPAGNRKITKTKSRFRIDGAVALVMAAGLKARLAMEDRTPSYTLEHGVMVL